MRERKADADRKPGMRFEGLGRLDVHLRKPSELEPAAAGVQGPLPQHEHEPARQSGRPDKCSTSDAT